MTEEEIAELVADRDWWKARANYWADKYEARGRDQRRQNVYERFLGRRRIHKLKRRAYRQ